MNVTRKRFFAICVLFVALFSLHPLLLFAQVSVLGELTRIHEVSPGGEFEGVIRLRNTGKEPAQVRVYLRDYTFDAEGTTGYLDPGILERSNAGWITLSATGLVLPEGEASDIRYVINVPTGGTLSGTYWSILMVEGIPEEVEEEDDADPLITIREVMRYGVQMVTTFSADGEGSEGEGVLQLSNAAIRRPEEPGQPRYFSIDIENRGSRWLKGEVSLEIYDQSGSHAASVSGGSFRTYPGTSVRRQFPIDELKPGTYKALLIADCGGSDLFGGNYTLQIRE